MKALFRAPAAKRVKYFITQVADREEAWALYSDSWVLAAASDGAHVFPLWPAEQFAQACASGDWADHEAVAISLDDLVDGLLPQLAQDGVLAGVLQGPDGQGVNMPASDLRTAIQAYCDEWFGDH